MCLLNYKSVPIYTDNRQTKNGQSSGQMMRYYCVEFYTPLLHDYDSQCIKQKYYLIS